MQKDLFFEQLATVLDDQGKVQYEANFLDSKLADSLFSEIKNSIDFKQEAISLFGRSVLQPRLTAWVADAGIEYEYSGLNSSPQPWTPALLRLKNYLQTHIAHRFNGVLCNYYRNGSDYMGWHSDDEKALAQQKAIASISLGADRRFDLRKKRHVKQHDQGIHSIQLQHGSLLIMSGDLQKYWQHRLPRQGHSDQARINLTFRLIQLQ